MLIIETGKAVIKKNNSRAYLLTHEKVAVKNISFWKFLFRFLPQNEYLSSAFSLNFLISFSVGQNLCLDFVAVQKHSIQPSQGLSPNTELLCCQTTWPVRNKRFPKSLRWSIYFFFLHQDKITGICAVWGYLAFVSFAAVFSSFKAHSPMGDADGACHS